MLDRGLPDPDTHTTAGELLAGGVTITVDRSVSLCHPQIVGATMAQDPAYLNDYPWYQMEPSFGDQSTYRFVPEARRNELSELLLRQFADTSTYFGAKYHSEGAWLWKSEAVLETRAFVDRDDYARFVDFFGWMEAGPDGCHSSAPCDEGFSAWPIATSSPLYSAATYEPGVTHLFAYRKGTSIEYGEVLGPYPLPDTEGSIQLYYRPEGGVAVAEYQWLSYRLDPQAKLAKVSLGQRASSLDAIGAPPAVPAASASCDGVQVVCMDRSFRPQNFTP